MKQLLKTIEQDEYSNKYYYDKMLSDFEMESRYNSIMRAIKNKWRSESLKYIERVHNMKEKNEENFMNRINRLQKSIDNKEKQSHDLFSEKEKRAKDTYNRKLKMDEFERTNTERKLIDRSKY